MKCKCGFEIEEQIAYKYGCLKCNDKSLINKQKLKSVKKQANNKIDICYMGVCQTLKEWADALDMNYNTLNGRKHRGLSIEEILKK